MNRRDFLLASGAISGMAAGSFLVRSHAAEAAPKKPNILYVLADDLGYGDVGCYNLKSKIPTPNIDRLASQGVRFTDAHDPAAVCTPTRYGILTGRYCWRSPLKRDVLDPWKPSLIPPGRLTVPAMLRQHGYTTAAFGKWHLGWDWPTTDGKHAGFDEQTNTCNVDFTKSIPGGPVSRGFDYFFGNDAPFHPPYVFIENDRAVALPTGVLPLADLRQKQKEGKELGPLETDPGPMVPGWDLFKYLPEITAKTIQYIERQAAHNRSEPLFIYMALPSPHTPIVPSPEFRGKSCAGLYGDWVYQTDWSLGQILAALDRTGLAGDTMVVFTSDNGPEKFAYQRILEYGHCSMGDLRGVKRDSWEGGHRVPFIVRWPGRVNPGTTCFETICHTDLMATCAAIVEARLPDDAGEDSYNILPALLGENNGRSIREATVMHSANGMFAIRQGDWVFIRAITGEAMKIEPEWFKQKRGYQPHGYPGELYNLSEDPAECKNLYGEHPEIVQCLNALLQKYIDNGRSTPGKPQRNDLSIKKT